MLRQKLYVDFHGALRKSYRILVSLILSGKTQEEGVKYAV